MSEHPSERSSISIRPSSVTPSVRFSASDRARVSSKGPRSDASSSLVTSNGVRSDARASSLSEPSLPIDSKAAASFVRTKLEPIESSSEFLTHSSKLDKGTTPRTVHTEESVPEGFEHDSAALAEFSRSASEVTSVI